MRSLGWTASWLVSTSLVLALAACGGPQGKKPEPDRTPVSDRPCGKASTARGFALVEAKPADTVLAVRGFFDSFGASLGLCPGDHLIAGDMVHFEVTSSESLVVRAVIVGSAGDVSAANETPVEIGPTTPLRLPPTGSFRLEGEAGIENLIVLASRGALSEADAALDSAVTAVLEGRQAPGVCPPDHPGEGSPFRARGKIAVVAKEHLVVATPDESGVAVVPYWLENAKTRSRGITLHEKTRGISTREGRPGITTHENTDSATPQNEEKDPTPKGGAGE